MRREQGKLPFAMYLVAGACVCLVLAVGAFTLFASSRPEIRTHRERRDDELKEQIRTLDRHVRLLQAQQAENENRRLQSASVEERPTDSSDSGDQPERKGANDPAPFQESPEEAQARTAARYEFLNDSFYSEARDEAWSTTVESEILAALEDPIFADARVDSATCASTMCKIELVLENESGFAEFQMKFVQALHSFLPRGTMKHRETNEGSLAVTAFLARPEARLPHFEPPEPRAAGILE